MPFNLTAALVIALVVAMAHGTRWTSSNRVRFTDEQKNDRRSRDACRDEQRAACILTNRRRNALPALGRKRRMVEEEKRRRAHKERQQRKEHKSTVLIQILCFNAGERQRGEIRLGKL